MEYPKKINATFTVENKLQEYKLYNMLEAKGGKYLNILPNTDHLKEDENYKKLVKGKKDAQLHLDRYVNSQNLKAK